MIINAANKRTIGQSPELPDMSLGIQGFLQKIIIERITKRNEKGYLKEYSNIIKTMGVRVAQSPAQLAIKPEGERTWKWSTLFLLPEPKLNLDDVVRIQGVRYRVMQKKDNKEYGCLEYELCEDYVETEEK